MLKMKDWCEGGIIKFWKADFCRFFFSDSYSPYLRTWIYAKKKKVGDNKRRKGGDKRSLRNFSENRGWGEELNLYINHLLNIPMKLHADRANCLAIDGSTDRQTLYWFYIARYIMNLKVSPSRKKILCMLSFPCHIA